MRNLVEHYSKNVILKLPHIHAVTSCNATSSLYGVGKIKVFKKCVNSKEKMNLLQDIGLNLFKQCATPEWKINQSQRQK